MTTVESSNKGLLPMAWRNSMLLYHAAKGCQASTAYAELSMYLDSDLDLDATFAYYFSGSLTGITDTYAYFGIEPSAYLGLRVQGLAQMQYQSQRVKLIDTLSWPGLAIKGLAAVGPTLDVWGQLQSVIQLSGQMQVGVRFNFEKSEWYWPSDADSSKYNELLDLEDNPEPAETGLSPVFDANVQASADLNVLVTPEANLGIKVGTTSLALVNAQLVAYVNTTLNFHAEASGTINTEGAGWSYSYGVWLYYNVGMGAVASLVGYDWGATRHDLFTPPKSVKLCCDFDVNSASSSVSRRSTMFNTSTSYLRLPRRGLLQGLGDSDGHIRPVTIDDIAYREPGNHSLPIERLFERQSSSNENAASETQPEFSLSQLFDCPQEAGCPCKICTSSTSTASTPALARRANAAAPCSTTLPDFRINCGIFSNVQVGTQSIRGICDNQQTLFSSLAVPNVGFVLTYDSDADRKKERGKFACGSGNACSTDNTLLQRATGYGSLTSCDEFPFRSVEEGGGYFGRRPTNPVVAPIACTPVWQQDIQAACNNIFRTLSTNIRYWDTVNDPNGVQHDWRSWSDDSWTTPPDNNNNPTAGGFNWFATYPGYIAQAGGVPTNTHNWGYFHKRNFTYGLAFPSGPTNGAAWGSQALTSYRSTSSKASFTSTDATQLLCAMNIFGQSDVYQYGNNNGLSVRPNAPRTLDGYGNTPSWVQCKVTFAGSPGPAKRDVEEWKVAKVEIDEDAEPVGWFPGDIDVNVLGPEIPAVVKPAS